MDKKCFILASGGIDSTTCIGLAVKDFGPKNVWAVNVKYGQRHIHELECCKKIIEHYGINQHEIDMSELFKYSNCSLLANSTNSIKTESYQKQFDEAKESHSNISTYVPFRNGLMLSAVTTFALSVNPDGESVIFIGCHADDFAYPDCSVEFYSSMKDAIYRGSGEKVTINDPLIKMKKEEIIAKGLEIGVPYQYTWSCYESGKKPCGKCASCIDRARAFKCNGIEDPAL